MWCVVTACRAVTVVAKHLQANSWKPLEKNSTLIVGPVRNVVLLSMMVIIMLEECRCVRDVPDSKGPGEKEGEESRVGDCGESFVFLAFIYNL